MKIIIAQEFTPYPEGRSREDSDFSGEFFRQKHLIPAFLNALKKSEKLEVCLEGMKILTPSFLEEAFGGLVREMLPRMSFGEIKEVIEITAESQKYDYFIKKTWNYMEEAAGCADNDV